MEITFRDGKYKFVDPENYINELREIIVDMYGGDEDYDFERENETMEAIIGHKYELIIDEDVITVELDVGLGNLYFIVDKIITKPNLKEIKYLF